VSVRYQPKNVLKRMAKKKAVAKLVTKKLTINKAALNAIERAGVLSKKELEKIALKVIKEYRSRYKDELAEGATKSAALEDATNEKRLMVQRVQSATLHEITQRVKANYRGEYYRWLPSTAANPDPKHMRKYGKVYRLGRGEAPGDRYGCQCGMEILVDESRLDIEE